MEGSVTSSSFKSVLSCSERQAQSAESSWTDYFVDLVLSEEEKRRRDASYGGDGGNHDDEEEEEDSMVSDAASCAPAALLPAKCKELRKLKKNKAFKVLDHDDCFEDTASSPVNSPKVSVLSQMELSPKRRCNIRDPTKEADGIDHGQDDRTEGMDCTDAAMEGERFVDQNERSITPLAELKDKGISLFPLSMLLQYHGRN